MYMTSNNELARSAMTEPIALQAAAASLGCCTAVLTTSILILLGGNRQKKQKKEEKKVLLLSVCLAWESESKSESSKAPFWPLTIRRLQA